MTGKLNTGGMLLGGGLAILGGVLDYKQASALAEAKEAQRKYNNQQANIALLSTYRSLEDQQDRVEEQALQNSVDLQKATAIAKGKATAQAGASGQQIIGGATVTGGISQQAGSADAINAMNAESKFRELDAQTTTAQTMYSQRVDLMEVQKPDPFSYAINAGMKGMRNSMIFSKFFIEGDTYVG